MIKFKPVIKLLDIPLLKETPVFKNERKFLETGIC
jgi:hypothetical protein